MHSVAKHLRITLNTLLAVAFAATFYVTSSTHTAPYFADTDTLTAAGQAEYAATTARKAHNAPEWSASLAAEFPSCAAINGLADTVVVVRQDGTASRMGFDEAWGRSQDDSWSNDVWTVGGC